MRNSHKFVKLHIGAVPIICTDEHPFFVNDGWKEAKDLRQGDSLFAFSGAKLRIDSVYQFNTDTATTVYNLEVAGNSNYYVSASGVLVHNCETAIKPLFEYSVHATQRMAQRGITQKMIEVTMRKGTQYWDPVDKSIVYYLKGASAKGHDMMIAVTPQNMNRIMTVNKGRRVFNKRWIPIE